MIFSGLRIVDRLQFLEQIVRPDDFASVDRVVLVGVHLEHDLIRLLFGG